MFLLKRFHQDNFQRINTVIESLHGHLTGYINLIGSSSLPFPEVCEAASLPASGCRVEGHLNTRYFPGTEPIDQVEIIAENAIRSLFDFDNRYSISIQPHSATQANHIVWKAVLQRGDTVLGLALNSGGHISHILGLPEGIIFKEIPFNNDGINYEGLDCLIKDLRPRIVVAGTSSYPMGINYERISDSCSAVGAWLHADIAHMAPFIVSGIQPQVVPYADSVTIDTSKNLRGPKGGVLLFDSRFNKQFRRAIFPLCQSSPNQSSMVAKACCFEIWLKRDINDYARQIVNNSKIMMRIFKEKGIRPVFADTESHLILIDLRGLGITGREAEELLENNKILVNRNSIPGEMRSASVASGIRVGTTAVTILGYQENDVKLLAETISDVLSRNKTDQKAVSYLIDKYHSKISNISNR
ncbi:hypothetical protein [Maridesulfovibrio sp.]|uniref:hypothetical protein n=1 Tax=Maridesulfovibrio sp. TaxID=2795000 RepID=UPI003B00615A